MFIAVWTSCVIDPGLGLDIQVPTAPTHLRAGLGNDLTSMGVNEGGQLTSLEATGHLPRSGCPTWEGHVLHCSLHLPGLETPA